MLATMEFSAGYGERVVLDALSVRFSEHRTTAILGPGASGKSTLLQALGGRFDAPEFWVRGTLVRGEGPFVTLPQRPSARPGDLAQRLARCAGAVLEDVWQGVPGAVELLEPALARPASATVSLARLAELTLAVASGAPVLLLDEPDASLDVRHRQLCRGLLEKLRRTRSILLVTHDLSLARAVSDEALLLVDGAVVECAATERFFADPRMPRTADFLRWGA